MRPTFNRVIAQDLRGVLPRIKASTLLIWGTEDRDTPLWMGEVMAKEIPDAALVRLEGCGHFAYLGKVRGLPGHRLEIPHRIGVMCSLCRLR